MNISKNLIYVNGDATNPITTPAIIAHICNDRGYWGKGFVMSLTNKFGYLEGSPEYSYRSLIDTKKVYLGQIQIVKLSNELSVCNMIAQHSIHYKNNVPPIRYDALNLCLKSLYDEVKNTSYTIHCPRIGCGLAGGSWDKIEPIIKENMSVDTYIYTIKG